MDGEFRLLEVLADAVIASDGEDRVLFVNAAAERLLGWPREELLGQPLTVLMPPRMRPMHEAGFHRYFRTRTPHILGKPIRVPALARDGRELDVELILAVTRVGEQDLVIATLRDLRERVELERQLRTRDRVAAQHEVMTVIAATRTPAEAWPRLLEATGRALGYQVGLSWIRAGERLRVASSWQALPGRGEAFLASSRDAAHSLREGPLGTAWGGRRPVLVPELGAHPDDLRHQVARAEGLRSAAIFPLLGRGEPLGVVEFLSAEPLEADEELSRTLETLGLQVGQFLERLKAEADLRENLEWFATTLRSVGDAVIATHADGTVRFMNAAAERLTGYGEREAVGRPLEEIFQIFNEDSGEPVESPTRRVLRENRVVGLANHTVLRSRSGDLVPIEDAGAPIQLGEGGVLGVVLVFRDASERKLLEVERLRRMHRVVRARLEAEQRARRATLLARAGPVLGASLHPEETLQRLAQLVVPDHADWCAVDLVEGERLRQVAVAHVDPRKVQFAEELGRRFPTDPDAPRGAPAVIRTGRPELYPDVSEALLAQSARGEEHLRLLRRLGMRSAMVVPLTARGRTCGALTLISAESGRHYDEEDLQFAEQLADRAALSVDNARLYQEAQAAVRLRDDFLSVASHELRTPLTPMQLQLAALRREGRRLLPSPEAAAAFEKRLLVVHRQSERLARLVNELLDISRLSAGRLLLELEPTDLGTVVREVLAHFSELGELERFGAQVEVEERPGVVGRWDRARVEQVVSNLLTNALKYGERRPIRISVGREGGEAILRVEDQGIGISPEDQQRIFGRFERAVSARHFGGLGLGLFIVRQVVEALGGSIEVRSAPGQGSTFTLRLPLAGPAGEELGAARLN